MHTYKRVRQESGDYLWTVGHYEIVGDEHFSSGDHWNAMKDFNTEREASAYVNYLNGGAGDLR
jgi:hypothetical protein